MRIIQPWILGRILTLLKGRFKEAFPDARGDIYDYLIPPKTFADWLRNLRLRHGLQQTELAKTLGVNRYTINRYEMNRSNPSQEVHRRLKECFGLNGELNKFFEPTQPPKIDFIALPKL